jgi:hypothetical protein
LVLATDGYVDPVTILEVLGKLAPGVSVSTLFSTHPLYWTLIKSSQALDRKRAQRLLTTAGVAVRYFACGVRGAQRLGGMLDFENGSPCRPRDWKARPDVPLDETATQGRWFVGGTGVDVRRSICERGAGTRLAVIDNDASRSDLLDLDAEVLVGVSEAPRTQEHAACMVAWAIGARQSNAPEAPRFIGVAPNASPRLYVIPKPGQEVYCLPLAIVTAVRDGADVVVCATYTDGLYSPMLDDALEFAARLGRQGRGAPVVLPASRELSSPAGSVHSSLSLRPADPSSDPRVFCVGPSARDGGWFVWTDKNQLLRPFANRGPALRWLAPGDDVSYPFAENERLCHAESSGAAALAAGTILLVLQRAPTLTLAELDRFVTATVVPIAVRPAPDGLADDADWQPEAADRDGHNAKHGYGRMNAWRACAAVSDPAACVMLTMGEHEAAARWLRRVTAPYSAALAVWAARAIMQDSMLFHALACVVRHCRLLADQPKRRATQDPEATLRLLGLLAREAHRTKAPPAPPDVERELRRLAELALGGPEVAELIEPWLDRVARELWGDARLQSDTRALRHAS